MGVERQHKRQGWNIFSANPAAGQMSGRIYPHSLHRAGTDGGLKEYGIAQRPIPGSCFTHPCHLFPETSPLPLAGIWTC